MLLASNDNTLPYVFIDMDELYSGASAFAPRARSARNAMR